MDRAYEIEYKSEITKNYAFSVPYITRIFKAPKTAKQFHTIYIVGANILFF